MERGREEDGGTGPGGLDVLLVSFPPERSGAWAEPIYIYIYTYIHTYIHIYIYIYIHMIIMLPGRNCLGFASPPSPSTGVERLGGYAVSYYVFVSITLTCYYRYLHYY